MIPLTRLPQRRRGAQRVIKASSRLDRNPANRYRSFFERKVARELTEGGVNFGYETKVIEFTQPSKDRKYTPDFILPNGVIVETKGKLTVEDRKKHLLVKEQHPKLDIRFVFQRAMNTLTKRSKTTYAAWAEKNGFKWANASVPEEWLNE